MLGHGRDEAKRTYLAQVFNRVAYRMVAPGWLHQNHLNELVKKWIPEPHTCPTESESRRVVP